MAEVSRPPRRVLCDRTKERVSDPASDVAIVRASSRPPTSGPFPRDGGPRAGGGVSVRPDEQPTAKVTSADVERIVRRDFDTDRVVEVLALLEQYGAETGHREVHRVRAAALKLAAGSVERLRIEIETAKLDYRDVLASAEYPGYGSVRIAELPADEQRRVVDADWKQYREWFER
jgi:hypothetical protein